MTIMAYLKAQLAVTAADLGSLGKDGREQLKEYARQEMTVLGIEISEVQ